MYVKILCKSSTMVSSNELLNLAREVVFLSKFQTFRYMANDDTCTLKVVQFVMWIDARLIFGEECWV